MIANRSLASSFQRRLEQGLGFLVQASLALGSAFLISRHGHTAPILWLEVAIVMLSTYLLLSGIWFKRRWRPIPVLVGMLPLAPVLALHQQQIDRSLIIFFHIGLGMMGGWGIACLWFRLQSERWTTIDTGLTVAGLASVVQLAIVLVPHNPLDFHERAVISWGASNYIAVVLDIIGLTLWGRLNAMRAPRWLRVAPLLLIVGALATLSRVALLGLLGTVAIGMIVRARNRPRARASVAILVGVACIAIAGVVAVSLVRSQHSGIAGVEGTVAVRVTLWRLSAEAFLGSPLTGTGFGTLRENAVRQFGISLTPTFAHNVELSMLQQGGLLGLPYLGLIGLCAYRGFQRNRGAGLQLGVLAVLLVSQMEPLFEDTVGGFFAWSVLFAAYLGLPGPASATDPSSQTATAAAMGPDGSRAPRTPERRHGLEPEPGSRQTE